MKKNYNTPKVEKLSFNYTETVTASGIPDGPSNSGYDRVWVATNHSYTRCICWDGHWEDIAKCN